MDILADQISNEFDKIIQLEEFVALYLRKEKILPELKIVNDRLKNMKELSRMCNYLKETYQTTVVDEHEKLMQKMHEQQEIFLDILEKLEENPEKTKTETEVKPNNLTYVQKVPETPMQMPTTPRMRICEYEQSPFVSRIKPIALQFIDFEVDITEEQFQSIPNYMRGRETLEEFRAFLQTVIIPCFTEKYQLLHRKFKSLRHQADIELWRTYHDQIQHMPDNKFITQDDIVRKINKLVDKRMSAKIVMLRHLGVLQEQRKKNIVFYLWTGNSLQ